MNHVTLITGNDNKSMYLCEFDLQVFNQPTDMISMAVMTPVTSITMTTFLHTFVPVKCVTWRELAMRLGAR